MGKPLTAAERILRDVTEANWQIIVINIARINGWSVYWPPPNRPGRNGHVWSIVAGWPDLAFVREGEFFLAELKRETGKTTDEQDEWIRLLRSAGVEVHVWRPRDEMAVRERLGRAAPKVLPAG